MFKVKAYLLYVIGFRFMFKDRLVSDAYIKINRGFVENLQETACGGSVLGTAAKGFENFRSFFCRRR